MNFKLGVTKLNKIKNLNPGFKQFLVKTGLFVGLFMAFIALIGTKLYQYDILSSWKIEIWGRIGYILLFSIAGFILLYRQRLMRLEYSNHKAVDYLVLTSSFIFLFLFYLFEVNAYRINLNFINIFLVNLLGISIFVFLCFGVYGINFIKKFILGFKKELSYFLIFGIITAGLMNAVWGLWPYFSIVVLKAIYSLFKIASVNAMIISPRTLIVGNFGARIEEACSGVYSIFLFTALYLFIILVDWKKINKIKAGVLFFPAIIGAFLVNILRVFLLFLIGAYVSREIAMNLYHSYTGMILFLAYFTIFWFLLYNWMKKPEFKSEKQGLVKRKYKEIMEDSLYKNSIFMMLSTLIMSFFGFVFWMIGARIFTAEEVGLATALISVMGLITSFSILGLNTGLIRYLPNAKEPNKKINTCFTLVAIVTIIISAIFLMGIEGFSSKLSFIKENILFAFAFIGFMIISSFSSLIDSIFIAYRDAKYILIKNSIFSILKIGGLFLFATLGAFGIFVSWVISLMIGFLVVLAVLVIKFNYKPQFNFHNSIIKKIGIYSFGNYAAGFIGGLPLLILPILILNHLGAEEAAYYYITMMIAGTLFIIPNATANSLFAEGSHNEEYLKKHIKKAIKIIALLLVPAILIILFFGDYILLLFGKAYSEEGFRFLQILAISGVFVSINAIFASLFKVKKKIKEIFYRNLLGTLIILGLSFLFIHNGYGLMGVGWAYLIGQIITAGMFVGFGRDRK